jgi:signal transduction histidine kinase
MPLTSIRRNLLVWLFGALVVGGIAIVLAVYKAAMDELDEVFDDQLKQIAYAVHVHGDWSPQLPLPMRPGPSEFLFSTRTFDADGRMVTEGGVTALRFDGPQAKQEGFSDSITPKGRWRVFTHVTPKGAVQVAQPHAIRVKLASELALRPVAPLFFGISLLLLFVGWQLRRSLRPLAETSRRVSELAADHLTQLPTADIPDELLPLVEQINALTARVQDSLDTQRRLVSDAAHELRSPVTALKLQLELARTATDDAKRDAAFGALQAGIGRAERLVRQLLALARLEPGAQIEAVGPVDVSALARDVVGEFSVVADAAGVDLGAEAPAPAVVTARPEALRSMLSNLVDNALRYAPSGSDVTVVVTADAREVRVEVRDAGPGIAPEQRERVFERFTRGAGDTTPGSGLGLAIVRAVARQHGGDVVLADAIPARQPPGLAVTVTLPKSAAR